MILYDPIEGDVSTTQIKLQPQTCFIMTQLGTPIPQEITNIRRTLEKYLKQRKFKTIDANSVVRGRDFLMKIWKMVLSVPVGIAIISENLTHTTLANIFYEIGLLQAYGKETLVIKTPDSALPSDFVRTEYIEYDRKFKDRILKFLDSLEEQAVHYAVTAKSLRANSLLAIDYLRRAFLITGDDKYKTEAMLELLNDKFDKHTQSEIDSWVFE